MSYLTDKATGARWRILLAIVVVFLMNMQMVHWKDKAKKLEGANTTLTAELAEWQSAAEPVFRSRGMNKAIYASTAKDLENALNPCYPVNYLERSRRFQAGCDRRYWPPVEGAQIAVYSEFVWPEHRKVELANWRED